MGPPLEVTFKEEISEEGAEQAVQLYRDYYETKGQFEAHSLRWYKRGPSDNLSQDPNKKIYITTSKMSLPLWKCADTLASLSF
ncbi:MAG: hypothetical protein ACLRSA_01435 [Streptococcus salivarius]